MIVPYIQYNAKCMNSKINTSMKAYLGLRIMDLAAWCWKVFLNRFPKQTDLVGKNPIDINETLAKFRRKKKKKCSIVNSVEMHEGTGKLLN